MMRRHQFLLYRLCFISLLSIGFVPFAHSATQIKDTESRTHSYDAAYYQVVETYDFPGFKVIQFNLPVLSHYSYVLISGKDALIVDPGRDIYAYLDLAKKENLTIKYVFLTHSHADFIAGHLELAKAVGCPIYASAISGAEYAFKPVREGDTLEIGQAMLKFVETPGHTPDGMSGYVYSRDDLNVPRLIFTGDAKFVGGMGRPDLIIGTTSEALASKLYDTWTKKLSQVGDQVLIFPAHGAGSLCGAHLSDKPFSTIGQEKMADPYVVHTGRYEFIAAVLNDLQEPPQYFKYNAATNRKGPALIDWEAPMPAPLQPIAALTEASKYYVVDVRDANEYAVGHIPNSVNIALRGRLETWVGIMVPWEAKVVLCGNDEELKEALYRLNRVGYKADVITFNGWKQSGLPIAQNKQIPPQTLYAQMQRGEAPMIVDVRLPNEWMGLRIGTVLNLPLNHLAELSAKLDSAQPVVTVCNSAYRSSMAVGILERKGFANVSSLEGGSEAWIGAGLPVLGAESRGGVAAAPAAVKRQINLPDRFSASELKRLIMDLPGTFDLIDIRPPEQFADYNLPASRNVDIADAINNPTYLTGAGPLIIVDRDGSLAMAVAGILSQKTQRTIKALYGGLESYWAESELRGVTEPIMMPQTPATRAAPSIVPPAAAPATGPPAQAPQPPKKKSAGC